MLRASHLVALPVCAASTGLLSSPGSTEPAGVPAAAQKLVARLVCEEHCNVFFTGNAGTGASCAPQRHNICSAHELCLMWLCAMRIT